MFLFYKADPLITFFTRYYRFLTYTSLSVYPSTTLEVNKVTPTLCVFVTLSIPNSS